MSRRTLRHGDSGQAALPTSALCGPPSGLGDFAPDLPATATHLGVSDILNPEENIKAGVKHISRLIRTYEDESSALLVYNAGAGVLTRERIPQETRRFIDQVLFLKSFLKDGAKRDDLS